MAIELLEANPTVRCAPSAPTSSSTLSPRAGGRSRAAQAGVKAVTPRSLRHDALRVTRTASSTVQPARPEEDFKLELRRRFSPEVVTLSEYLGRDLVSLWGYDALD